MGRGRGKGSQGKGTSSRARGKYRSTMPINNEEKPQVDLPNQQGITLSATGFEHLCNLIPKVPDSFPSVGIDVSNEDLKRRLCGKGFLAEDVDGALDSASRVSKSMEQSISSVTRCLLSSLPSDRVPVLYGGQKVLLKPLLAVDLSNFSEESRQKAVVRELSETGLISPADAVHLQSLFGYKDEVALVSLLASFLPQSIPERTVVSDEQCKELCEAEKEALASLFPSFKVVDDRLWTVDLEEAGTNFSLFFYMNRRPKAFSRTGGQYWPIKGFDGSYPNCPFLLLTNYPYITFRALQEGICFGDADQQPVSNAIVEIQSNLSRYSSRSFRIRPLFPIPDKAAEPDDVFDNFRLALPSFDVDSYVSAIRRRNGSSKSLSPSQLAKLKTDFDRVRKSTRYLNILRKRQCLPVSEHMNKILETIESHNICVIQGEPGCGKTTQIPQFILDLYTDKMENVNIVVAQPRRIAATSVASRVAFERCENVGDTVGYQIRLESKISNSTRLCFCTTGVILRRLIQSPDLSGVTHLFLDEVHERDLDIDFLLGLLKEIETCNMKIILMSATISAKLFSKYFDNAPILEIPGFTFSVELYYLEDIVEMTDYRIEPNSEYSLHGKSGQGAIYKKRKQLQKIGDEIDEAFMDEEYEETMLQLYPNTSPMTREVLAEMNTKITNYELLAELVEYIVSSGRNVEASNGSILVFLSGFQEIITCLDVLKSNANLSGVCDFYPCHSSMPQSEQRKVFNPITPGRIKIVLSTNICETSLTIDDVSIVIDTGKMKVNNYNPQSYVSSLIEIDVSKASAKQRSGRAGRTAEGHCFRLYPHYEFDGFKGQNQPEIKRSPLHSMILHLMLVRSNVKAEDFLKTCIEPPSSVAIASAYQTLIDLGTVEKIRSSYRMTPLGFYCAQLPVDPPLAKLMIMSCVLGCLDSGLIVAAAMSVKSPFVSPIGRREDAQRIRVGFAGRLQSDQIASVRAFRAFEEACKRGEGKTFCHAKFLSYSVLLELRNTKKQFHTLLRDMNLLHPHCNSNDRELTKRSQQVRKLTRSESIQSQLSLSPIWPILTMTAMPTHPNNQLKVSEPDRLSRHGPSKLV